MILKETVPLSLISIPFPGNLLGAFFLVPCLCPSAGGESLLPLRILSYSGLAIGASVYRSSCTCFFLFYVPRPLIFCFLPPPPDPFPHAPDFHFACCYCALSHPRTPYPCPRPPLVLSSRSAPFLPSFPTHSPDDLNRHFLHTLGPDHAQFSPPLPFPIIYSFSRPNNTDTVHFQSPHLHPNQLPRSPATAHSWLNAPPHKTRKKLRSPICPNFSLLWSPVDLYAPYLCLGSLWYPHEEIPPLPTMFSPPFFWVVSNMLN